MSWKPGGFRDFISLRLCRTSLFEIVNSASSPMSLLKLLLLCFNRSTKPIQEDRMRKSSGQPVLRQSYCR